MGYRIEMACVSHTGYIREKNEDNFYFNGYVPEQKHGSMPEPLQDLFSTEEMKMAAVFDGMGGINAGETASYVAAQKFSELCRTAEIGRTGILRMVRKMNAAVCRKAKQDKLGQIGTTATMLFFQEEYAYIINVGDSPAYILRNGRLKFIAEKHTNEEMLKLSGLKKQKPSLTQFLGIPEEEMALEPYIAGIEMRVGDVFIICSDGLTDMVRDEDIRKVLNKEVSASCMAEELLSEALENGGFDNITVICCKVVENGIACGRTGII